MPPRHLPALPPGPLTLASARELGLSDHDWRAAGPRRTQTVRSAAGPTTTRERAALYLMALPPDCASSHVTAAQLWGLPLARAVEDQAELDVIRAPGRANRRPVSLLADTHDRRVRPRNAIALTEAIPLVRPGSGPRWRPVPG